MPAEISDSSPVGGRSAERPVPFRALDPRFIALASSLFITAMGANAFVQFAVPYLISIRGWSTAEATGTLIVAFVLMPSTRIAYTFIARYIGDYGSLLLGHLLYFVYLGLLTFGSGPVALGAMGATLGLASALVFMAGPLQIMHMAEQGGAGKASGAFFASNFLAWLIAIPSYGALIKWQGFAVGPYAAAVVTLLGACACAVFTPRDRPIRQPVEWRQLKAQFARPSIQFLTLLMLMSSFSFGFMFGTFATFVTFVYGAVTMSFLAIAFYFARLPSSIVAGLASDRYGANSTLTVTFAIAALALGLAAARFDLSMLVVAIVILGVIQAAVPVVGMSTVTISAPVHLRPLAYAPVMGAAELGVGVSLAIGLLLQRATNSPAAALGLVAAAYAVCAVILISRRPLDRH